MTEAPDESGSWRAYALVLPALAVIVAFFVLPLMLSAVLAFRGKGGELTFEHFEKAWDLYRTDLLFTIGIVLLVDGAHRGRLDRDRRLSDARREPACGRRAALALSVAVVHPVHRHRAGHADVPRQERHAQPRADRFRVDRAACGAEPARLARHRRRLRLEAGAVRHVAASPARWRRWKSQHIEAARNLGARRLRVLIDIVLPQVRGTLLVGLVLSFVTMLSVLSVPLMINPELADDDHRRHRLPDQHAG